MQTTAKAKSIKISPKKVRLVADLIRGLDVEEAGIQLKFIKKASVLPLAKLIKSAISNAEENYKLQKNNLFIKEIRVDEGITTKRWQPRAMGRATPINKRSSNITLILDERIPTEAKDIEIAKSAKTVKDDIIKIDDFDKIKSDQKDDDKKGDGSGKGTKVKEGTKNVSKKLFNRRSGER